MKPRKPRTFLRRLGRWVWKSLGALPHLILMASIVFALSGYCRPTEVEQWIHQGLTALEQLVRVALAAGWVHDDKVEVVMACLRYLSFATILLLGTYLIRRIPCFVPNVVLTEFDRRRGRLGSALEQLLTLSLPGAIALCLIAEGMLSLLAWCHFLLAYSFVRLLNHPRAMDATLNWYSRIRSAVDSPLTEADDADADVPEE